MDSLKHYSRIIAYESGNLNAKQVSKFEEELSEGGLLSREYRSYQASSEVSGYLAYQETKSLLSKISKEGKEDGIIRPINKWAMAASIALIFSASLAYLWLENNYSNGQLIQNNYYALNLSEVRAEGGSKNVLKAPYDAYISGRYQAALDILETINSDATEVDLLRGHLFLKLEQPDNAILSLTKVLQKNDQRFNENAKWHIGLAYLAKNDLENAHTIFESFLDSETPLFQNQSNLLLQKIDTPLWRLIN